MAARYALPILLPLFSHTANAQWPTLLVSDTLHRPCPWDSSTTIFTYQDWEAYQTLDSTWDGPRDSTICIDLAHAIGVGFFPYVAMDDIDPARPVFVRALLDTTNAIPVDTNTLYLWELSLWPSASNIFDTASNCYDGLCSGALVAVRVPDSLGTGSNLRWYQSHWDISGWASPLELCMPTERMVPNQVQEIIYKITPTGAFPGEEIHLQSPFAQDAQDFGWLNKLTEAGMAPYQTGPAEYVIGFGDNLIMYEDSTYPSAQHLSFLDLTPVPNTASPQTVTLTFDPYTSLHFQPFAELRGGFVLGSDSIHHPLNVVNNGMDICLGSQIIELIWEGENRYTHQAGHIDFEGSNSCMLFGKGGTLCVAEGAVLHYGGSGRGLMALKTGGRIVIERGAELVMHGMMVLYEYADETTPTDLYMTLPEGAKLTFAPGSHVWNQWSMGQDMKLYVYLDGGIVDKSGLPENEQERVVVIPLPQEPLSSISLAGEVGSGSVDLLFGSREAGTGNLTMIDASGRLVVHAEVNIAKGPNAITVGTRTLGPGSYVVVIDRQGERSSGRFVIL